MIGQYYAQLFQDPEVKKALDLLNNRFSSIQQNYLKDAINQGIPQEQALNTINQIFSRLLESGLLNTYNQFTQNPNSLNDTLVKFYSSREQQQPKIGFGSFQSRNRSGGPLGRLGYGTMALLMQKGDFSPQNQTQQLMATSTQQRLLNEISNRLPQTIPTQLSPKMQNTLNAIPLSTNINKTKEVLYGDTRGNEVPNIENIAKNATPNKIKEMYNQPSQSTLWGSMRTTQPRRVSTGLLSRLFS